MKKLIIMFLLFGLCPLLHSNERPINEVPMYGGKQNPTVEQNSKFSRSASKLGWEYFYNGDIDTSIKRFNQAWMFDRNNYEAYWGFGLIMGVRAQDENTENNLRESIRFLQKAFELNPKNGRVLGDQAFSHTVLGYYLKSTNQNYKEEFSIAENLFEKAYKLDSKYPPIVANWSVLKFYSEQYKSAKELMEKAKSMGYEPDPAYVKDLNGKL